MIEIVPVKDPEKCPNVDLYYKALVKEHPVLIRKLINNAEALLDIVLPPSLRCVKYRIELTCEPAVSIVANIYEQRAEISMKLGVNALPLETVYANGAGLTVPQLTGILFVSVYVKHLKQLRPLLLKIAEAYAGEESAKTLEETWLDVVWPWPFCTSQEDVVDIFLGDIAELVINGTNYRDIVRKHVDALTDAMNSILTAVGHAMFGGYDVLTGDGTGEDRWIVAFVDALWHALETELSHPVSVVGCVTSFDSIINNMLISIENISSAELWNKAYITDKLVETCRRLCV